MNEALRLEEGATIVRHSQAIYDSTWLSIYACSDVAERVLAIPKGSKVRAEGTTVYGTTKEVEFSFSEDGSLTKTEGHKGLPIDRIVQVTPPGQEAS